MDISSFKKQHVELLEIVTTISGYISSNTVAENSKEISQELSRLGVKIGMHLAMEDKALYPRMVAAADATIADTAKKFQEEMGGLGGAFATYKAKWATASAIEADAGTFTTETKGIAQALGDRIKREEAQLYPMAEKV